MATIYFNTRTSSSFIPFHVQRHPLLRVAFCLVLCYRRPTLCHLPSFLFVLSHHLSAGVVAAGCIVETQFKFDLHRVLAAIGLHHAPTHEQNDY